MSKSYIQKLIEKYQNSKVPSKVGSGLLALATTLTMLTSCDDVISNVIDNSSSVETTISTPNPNNPNGLYPYGTYNATFSDTYNNAKEYWKRIWYKEKVSFGGKSGFQLKGAPFRFLQDQGVVACDEKGYLYAIGNEDYKNNYCIEVRVLADVNSKKNDLYLLVQYLNAPVDNKNMNDNVFVSTWMLKYSLDADCYKDLLALNNDFRANLLIQQIDEEYEPQIISHSVINYDLLRRLDVFKNLPNTESNPILKPVSDSNNYIEKIDYDNLNITVNFTSGNAGGKVYSYTYNLKETPNWFYALEHVTPTDYVPNLTNEEIMIKYGTFLGNSLSRCEVLTLALAPSDEQKALAELKYDFSEVHINSSSPSESFENYRGGRIKYEQVNKLTEKYASSSDEYSR